MHANYEIALMQQEEVHRMKTSSAMRLLKSFVHICSLETETLSPKPMSPVPSITIMAENFYAPTTMKIFTCSIRVIQMEPTM